MAHACLCMRAYDKSKFGPKESQFCLGVTCLLRRLHIEDITKAFTIHEGVGITVMSCWSSHRSKTSPCILILQAMPVPVVFCVSMVLVPGGVFVPGANDCSFTNLVKSVST